MRCLANRTKWFSFEGGCTLAKKRCQPTIQDVIDSWARRALEAEDCIEDMQRYANASQKQMSEAMTYAALTMLHDGVEVPWPGLKLGRLNWKRITD